MTGDRVAQPPPSATGVDARIRRPQGWTGTAIMVGFGIPPTGKSTVGTTAGEILITEMPMVIQDHLAGELADFIAIGNSRLTPEVRLVHCKASGGKKPAARLGDVQELAAQAIRIVQWLAPGAELWAGLRRRLDERQATKILKGDRNDVIRLLDEYIQRPAAGGVGDLARAAGALRREARRDRHGDPRCSR